MAIKIDISEVFCDGHLETQERKKIMEEDLPTTHEGMVYYYRNKKEIGKDKVEEGEMVPCDSLFTRSIDTYHITQILKLHMGFKISSKRGMVESLVNYSQSQFLTSNHDISSLKTKTTRKERV